MYRNWLPLIAATLALLAPGPAWGGVSLNRFTLDLTNAKETEPAASATESTPVEKAHVAVSVVLKRASFSADDQPEFIVRFKNVGADYRNLYDVAAYWNWKILLRKTDPQGRDPAAWQLRMNALQGRGRIDHRQIKAGESTEVAVDLNDPPFTFYYDPRTRNLPPGRYRLTVTVALTNPFGDKHHQWSGPVTTEPVELTITESIQTTATREELAAYDAAIARVTDNLGPGGLWMNGSFPQIDLASDAKTEDVIDAAVNGTSLDSKAYRLLRIQPFHRGEMPGAVSGSAALLRVGKAYKVVILIPSGKSSWWSRFYDADVVLPKTPGR